MSALGLEPYDFIGVRKAPAHQGPQMLRQLKRRVRKAYKAAALRYHPDKTGGDAEKTRMFQAVTEVLGEVEDLEYHAPRPTFVWKFSISGRSI